ncbi:MAG TPA: hypothetical protein PKH33_10395 [bacterium]|nr:hypothetical protein [bacterium]
MQTVEGSFFAVFNADTGDYDVGIPKIAVTDPEDGQEKVFGDTGGLFCPFRESGFQFPLLAPDAQRKVAKPPAMRSRMVSGKKPIYAHAMILDRGGPVWNDTIVCRDLIVTELTAEECLGFLHKVPTRLLQSYRIVESVIVLAPPAAWGEDYTVCEIGGE